MSIHVRYFVNPLSTPCQPQRDSCQHVVRLGARTSPSSIVPRRCCRTSRGPQLVVTRCASACRPHHCEATLLFTHVAKLRRADQGPCQRVHQYFTMNCILRGGCLTRILDRSQPPLSTQGRHLVNSLSTPSQLKFAACPAPVRHRPRIASFANPEYVLANGPCPEQVIARFASACRYCH